MLTGVQQNSIPCGCKVKVLHFKEHTLSILFFTFLLVVNQGPFLALGGLPLFSVLWPSPYMLL